MSAQAQQKFSVSGRIIENNLEGAPIPFAHVYLNGTSIGAQAGIFRRAMKLNNPRPASSRA